MHEPVLTPKGWRPIGDLVIGDRVIDPTTGGSQRVIGLFPQGVQRIWRVTCDDGAWTDVGADHLWAYRVANRRRPALKAATQRQFAAEVLGGDVRVTRWDTCRIGTTAELLEVFEEGQSPRIPLTEPVLFDVNGRTGDGDVSAYAAGCLLGDGHIPSLTVTCGEDDLRGRLIEEGFVPGNELHSDGKPKDYRAVGEYGRALRMWTINHGLKGARSWEKFIPPYVFTASVQYRLAFLQGLMDTDGYVDERGRCYFNSVSEALAAGVQALVRSMGGKASITDRQTQYPYQGELKDGRPSFQVRAWLRRNSAMFRMERKVDRCTDSWNGGYELSREIVSIKEVEPQDAVCIKVSGPRGLYVTRDYIVTHNTDGVLGKWAVKAQRYGNDFNGVFFRKEMPQADDLIERAKEIYLPIGAEWREQPRQFRMPGGGRVRFRPLENVVDASKYQGQSLSDCAVEEAGNFEDPKPIDMLFGAMRSKSGVPIQLILTANPGGVGQQWIKHRYIDPAPRGMVPLIRKLPNGEKHHFIYIPSRIQDNRILLQNDPTYINRLHLVGSPELVRAWLEGDWNVIAGAFFPEFSAARHIMAPRTLPDHWARFRSFDWGSARPFAVHWWAVSDGSLPDIARGCLVCYREWYGMKPNEPNVGLRMTAEQVAEGIRARERDDPKPASGMMTGVADPAIFAEDGGPSIAMRMTQAARVVFRPADNKRVPQRGAMGGWDQLRSRLVGDGDGKPMITFFSTAIHAIRTLPTLQHDANRAEDVDTDSEDHCADGIRYGCMSRPYVRDLERQKPRDSWDAAFNRDAEELRDWRVA
jgi:hypothetical protein